MFNLLTAVLAAAEMSAQEILADAGMTILIGVVVVFAVLLLLTGIFKVFGLTVSAAGKKPVAVAEKPAAVPAAPVAAAAPIVGNTQTVQTTQEIQNGISAETVAVVSAAVAAVAPAGCQYAVRSIRKA